MKKLFAAVILTIISLSSVWAEYKLDGSENNVHTDGMVKTTSIEFTTTADVKMHPSWDKDEDGINDCEKDGTCDHTIDYTLPKKGEEPKICTMEYAPVCAQVEIQCVTTPCNPVEQTFSNTCSAGENKILYSGECNSFVDAELLLSYNKHNETISQRFEKLSDTTLELMISDLDARISAVKNSRIAQFVQVHRITQYTYVKQQVLIELSNR